jgi:hypothetical protein
LPDPDSRPAANHLAPPIKRFVKVQLLLTLACILTELFCHFALHLKSPYDYPFYAPDESFWDFLTFAPRFQHFGHPEFFTGNPKFPFLYPAPVAVFFELFYGFGNLATPLFLSFILETFAIAALLLHRALRRRGVSSPQSAALLAFSLLLSYPIWFDFKQGNIEIGIWLFVALGVWAFCANRGYSAAACFGIAGSMKIFPFIYLGLLLAKRKYREIAFSLAIAALTTITSLWLLGGNDIPATWRHIKTGIDTFRTVYMLVYRPREIGFDHSLFAIVKCIVPTPPWGDVPASLLTAYLATGALAGIALYFLKIRHLPLINQVLCLSVASILLPPVSYDYTLMHLYIPWAMLVLYAQQQTSTVRNVAARISPDSPLRNVAAQNRPGLSAAFLLLAILFAPESEFIHAQIRFGGQIKAGALMALLLVGLKFPFPPATEAAEVPALPTR